jgi:sirohydrochlorin ferrochelatase
VLLGLAARRRAAPAPYGVLILAHGGDAAWNREIEILRARVNATVPVETALGMADVASLQAAVDRLEKRGVRRIAAVPLFVQSRSEVLDQTRYALGLAEKPSAVLREAYARMGREHATHAAHGGRAAGGHGHAMEFSTARVKTSLPISMSPALDDHALVVRILGERAKALSKKSSRETVILVAHGPTDDAALPAWETSLANLAAGVKAAGQFAGAEYAMLRDDAPAAVRAAAVAGLRRLVAAGAVNGRAIVVPVLIARGGIEGKISRDLEGLDYAWDAGTLMPHDGFDAWVLERAEAASR